MFYECFDCSFSSCVFIAFYVASKKLSFSLYYIHKALACKGLFVPEFDLNVLFYVCSKGKHKALKYLKRNGNTVKREAIN